MKKKLAFCVLFILFILGGDFSAKAQCKDSSNVSLKETSEWIKLIISQHSEMELPPIKFSYQILDTCKIRIYKMGYDFSKNEISDTSIIYEFDYKDFIPSKSKFESINKKNTKYFLKLYFYKLRIITKSEESGDKILDITTDILNTLDENKEYIEIFVNQKDEANLPVRIINAFSHAKCLCGESQSEIDKKQKSKF